MLKIIDALPDTPRKYNSELSKEILAFLENDDAQFAEASVEGYSSFNSAEASLRGAISKLRLDISVMRINGRVFLVKGGAAC